MTFAWMEKKTGGDHQDSNASVISNSTRVGAPVCKRDPLFGPWRGGDAEDAV